MNASAVRMRDRASVLAAAGTSVVNVRRPWRWLLGAVVVASLVAAGLFAWALVPRHPGENSAEAGFARDMITHHEQAVEMARIN